MLEILTARFADHQAALVSPSQSKLFGSCLTALARDEDGAKCMKEVASEQYWLPSDNYMARFQPYVVRNGTLIIPVKGVLLHDFPWQFYNYATGYEYIWKAYERGLGDPEVKRIALREHSPGGEVAGCFDLVDKMFARRGEKPLWAFAHEGAYSAAYAVASVADKIIVSRTGGVGSIGVVTSHVDLSKMMENDGLKVTFISAPEDGFKTDGNPYEALKPETKKRIQARINDLYDIFVSTVSRNRGLDEASIRETKALCFSANEAIENGLADQVATLEDGEAAFAADITENEEEDEQMKEFTKAELDAARAEGFEAGKAQGVTEGTAAGKAEGATNGKTEGRTEERARIGAILATDNGKTRPLAALNVALETDMDAEKANTFLGKFPEESTETASAPGDFRQAMNSTGNPNVGDGGNKGEGDEEASISELGAQFGLAGIKRKAG